MKVLETHGVRYCQLSLTAIEAIRQGASRSSIQVMYSKQGIALIAALPQSRIALPMPAPRIATQGQKRMLDASESFLAFTMP
jgi:hypothetical protein